MMQDASSEGMNKEAYTPIFRPNSALVRIDSISINIEAVKQSKSEKCEHFTIRGFVSDNRENNGDSENFESISRLHYLDVPKFRRWQCQSCLSEINVEGASKDIQNVTVNRSRRPHRSLEDVVAHLSKKLKQCPELASRQCKRTKSASQFTPKQIVDSALDLIARDCGENEEHSAASDYISEQPVPGDFTNQLATFKFVKEHQNQRPRSEAISSTKVIMVDGATHMERHAAGMELVHKNQNLDDSGANGRRKPKKIRLLNELLGKEGKGSQPVVTEDFHANEAAKVRSSGKKRNKKCLEQDSKHKKANAGCSGGKSDTRKGQDTNITFANAERHITSKDDHSDPMIKRTDNMILASKRGADGQKNSHGRGQKRKIDSCTKQGFMPTCQPLHSRELAHFNNVIPSSRSKGKSFEMLNKVHGAVNYPAPDNSKELDVNSLPQMPMETVQISHHIQSVPDDYSSKGRYLFSDGCLDTRKGSRYYVPHTEIQDLRTDISMPYMGESSSACKSLIEKHMWQGTNSNSDHLKRPNWGSSIGNKKPNYSTRTEQGLTVVPQMEFSSASVSKKMVGIQKNPEITHNKFSDNTVQDVGISDDIPMEIVELMAKNQYERRQHEVGDNHYVLQSASNPNPKHDVEGNSTGVLSKMVATAAQNKNWHLPKAREISEKGSGISNKKPNGYMVQRPYTYTGSTYGPVLSRQRELSSVPQSSALDSRKPDIFQNYKYGINNFPPEHRVSPRSQPIYEAWQPASQQNVKTARSWSMIPPNHPARIPSVSQISAFQPFDVRTVPVCLSYVVDSQGLGNSSLTGPGHSINDFRLDTSNTSRPNRVDGQPQMTGSPNQYDNETIPAMHLLSLMDGSMQTSTPTNKEAKANRKTFDKSFSNDHLAKELSVNNVGAGKSSCTFKQPSPYGNQSKALHSDASCGCSPPAPTSNSGVLPLFGDVGNKKGTQPRSRHPERTYLDRTAGGFPLPTENNGFKSQKPWSDSTGGLTGQELVLANELSKPIFSPFGSVSGSSHSYMNGNINGYCNLKSPEYYDTLKRHAEARVCFVNRNPMDFTAPGPGNEYMIGAEDLKFRNKTHIPYVTRPNASRHPRFTSVHCFKQ